VSLSSFRALRRQHTNSLSESHTVFVNTLNEVLNSPSISVTAPTTTGTSTCSSASSSACTSPPINIIQPPAVGGLGRRNGRSNSISSNGSSPSSLTSGSGRISSSFNTASVQTELSL